MTAIQNRGSAGLMFALLLCGCASAAHFSDESLLMSIVENELVPEGCESSQPEIQNIESSRYRSYYAAVTATCDGMPHDEYTLRGFVFDKRSLKRLEPSAVIGDAVMQIALQQLRERQGDRTKNFGFECDLQFSLDRQIYVTENDEPVIILNYAYPNQACSVAYNLVTKEATYPFE